jgi:hypothetical protein
MYENQIESRGLLLIVFNIIVLIAVERRLGFKSWSRILDFDRFELSVRGNSEDLRCLRNRRRHGENHPRQDGEEELLAFVSAACCSVGQVHSVACSKNHSLSCLIDRGNNYKARRISCNLKENLSLSVLARPT